MPKVELNGFILDARPDRVDIRDREYQPILKSLPREWPDRDQVREYKDQYVRDGLILDQGKEGACTGFGLAAVVNYLLWRRAGRVDGSSPVKVSPRMLYHLARFYDEWPGEDYEGSSCRGAMKGWHRHGVCKDGLWPYRTEKGKVKFIEPKSGWDADAALRPLGAYYRINKNSISDMQAAILEVGAVYVSASVHDGWFPERWRSVDGIALIAEPRNPEKNGGHAFAIVGYNAHGFIVQNSWGRGWGTDGFAILPYGEWVERGTDAWVAVLGAPMHGAKSRHYHTPASLNRSAPEPAGLFGLSEKKGTSYRYRNREVQPWDLDEAYRHSIVMGNNGVILNRSVQRQDALASLENVVLDKPAGWLTKERNRIAFYAHGGLNDEPASIARVRVLGPYFEANGIYPIFFTWKTGFLESLRNIIGDKVQGIEPQGAWRDVWEGMKNAAKEARDRAVEVGCQSVLVKTIWAQMKQNAEAAATSFKPTLGRTVTHLRKLKDKVPNLELHIIGHSAGSILLGHMLRFLGDKRLTVKSCTLFAPACTVGFALEHYKPAIEKGILQKSDMAFEILTNEREEADSVGPYGKSLLYLVSRALEDYHKTPILGMAKAWDPGHRETSIWHEALRQQVDGWQKFWGDQSRPREHGKQRAHVSNGVDLIPLAHGSFDNDVEVVARTLARILAVHNLVYPVENLRGY